VQRGRLESAWRRCLRWHAGVSNASLATEATNHVPPQRNPSAPPSLTPTARTVYPRQLWALLTDPQQQALVRLLSELLERRLLCGNRQEVTNEAS
jgi:hypothetical protein